MPPKKILKYTRVGNIFLATPEIICTRPPSHINIPFDQHKERDAITYHLRGPSNNFTHKVEIILPYTKDQKFGTTMIVSIEKNKKHSFEACVAAFSYLKQIPDRIVNYKTMQKALENNALITSDERGSLVINKPPLKVSNEHTVANATTTTTTTLEREQTAVSTTTSEKSYVHPSTSSEPQPSTTIPKKPIPNENHPSIFGQKKILVESTATIPAPEKAANHDLPTTINTKKAPISTTKVSLKQNPLNQPTNYDSEDAFEYTERKASVKKNKKSKLSLKKNKKSPPTVQSNKRKTSEEPLQPDKIKKIKITGNANNIPAEVVSRMLSLTVVMVDPVTGKQYLLEDTKVDATPPTE